MADLELVLLSKPRIVRQGSSVNAFAYNKSVALLAYLATTGRAHSREELAGLLWSEMPEQSARANLRKVLSELNESLPSYLQVGRQAVMFNFQSSHWVDANVFQSRLQSLKFEASRTVLDDHETRLLGEAVDLYHGDFLAGFYVHDAPAFEEWVLTQRERYRHLLLSALHMLAKHYTACGDYAAGIDYTTRLLALEPWHEEFHQQMMLLLAWSDQRSAALRQYEICRSVLDHELGVAPSTDTTKLFQQIQAGQVAAPRARRLAPPHNLPAEVTPFIGRYEELRAISARLRDPQCRLLTLVGISGSGKTRLAVQVACESLATFPDGSTFVDLNTAQGANLGSVIVDALGLGLEDGQDTSTVLLGHLREKHTLLVLDGMECVLDDQDILILMEVLRYAPGVKLLATSLERLALEGEWVLPIYGLEVPIRADPAYSREEAPDLSPERPVTAPGRAAALCGAVQLFLAAAQRAQAGFEFSETDLPAIIRICQTTEGLPLAIELASSWVKTLSVQEIADEMLTNCVDFLTTTSRSLPERHRSLCAALNYSCRRLDEQDRSMLTRLAAFRGGFGREAAEQIAGATLPFLALLIDCGFLQRSASGQYILHWTMSEYGRARLAADPQDETATLGRHCAYFLAGLEQRWRRWRSHREARALDGIAGEMPNIEAAWQWALRRPEDGILARFASVLTAVAGEALPAGNPAWHEITACAGALLAAEPGAALP